MGQVIKIGIFYDGGYFSNVSKYYKHEHTLKRHIYVSGLHELIRNKVADFEEVKPDLCTIIDAHFFRGRFLAYDAKEKEGQLYRDRVFDDILMHNNIQTHYLPLKDFQGRKREKGVDVLMALETYELCMLKRYDAVVLIASDGDHVPLVRKIHGIGCRTVLLEWNFEFTDEDSGKENYTRTSKDLSAEVTYVLDMSNLIDEELKNEGDLIENIFVKENDRYENVDSDFDLTIRHTGKVMELKGSYGFIEYPNNNLFFPATNLIEGKLRYDDISVGQELEFSLSFEEGKGKHVATRITRPGEYEGLVQGE